MSPFPRVTQGQPINRSARVHNALMQMAEEWMRRQATGGQSPNDDGVLVKNDSGSDIDRCGVLGIDSVIFTPTDNLEGFKNKPLLRGILPSVVGSAGKFVICPDPIPNGQVGRALLSGVAVAKVYVNAEGDGFADVKDGDADQLSSGKVGGAQILYVESGTGTKWAVVRVSNVGPFDITLNGCCKIDENSPTTRYANQSSAQVDNTTGSTLGISYIDAGKRQCVLGRLKRPVKATGWKALVNLAIGAKFDMHDPGGGGTFWNTWHQKIGFITCPFDPTDAGAAPHWNDIYNSGTPYTLYEGSAFEIAASGYLFNNQQWTGYIEEQNYTSGTLRFNMNHNWLSNQNTTIYGIIVGSCEVTATNDYWIKLGMGGHYDSNSTKFSLGSDTTLRRQV